MTALPPRWRKIIRDLWLHRGRTVLVALSSAVGVFAIGTVVGTRELLSQELDASFDAIQPASAIITTMQPFDEDLVETVGNMAEVGAVEGRRSVFVRVRVGADSWRNVQLNAIEDYDDIPVDRVLPDEGAWPPPERTLLIERSALGLTQAEIGDELLIRSPSGKERTMRVSGTAFDVYALPYTLDGIAWGYVTYDTMDWLGEPRSFNELHLTVAENTDDRDHIVEVVEQVRDKVERGGRAIFIMTIPEPGKHPLDSTIQAMLLLLGAMGALALGLSGFLVTNTISAVIAQEVRSIGLMKAIGAVRSQLAGLYAGMVLAYGLMALLIALPTGILGTIGFSRLMGGYLNLDIPLWSISERAILLQALVALIVPLVAAALPIVGGTRISVREALTSYGLGKGQFGQSRLDRLLEGLRGFSRPVLLAFRNTFRRKGRLALTLITLSLAGAMFIAVTSIQSSLSGTLETLISQWRWDVALQMSRSYRVERMRAAALTVPGVADAEGWVYTTARHTSATNSSSSSMMSFTVPLIIFAAPEGSELLRPPVVRGRWLMPGDENAVAISASLLEDEPGLDVGGEIMLKVDGRDTLWRVVGIVQGLGPAPIVYANYEFVSDYLRESGRAQFLAVVTQRHDQETQSKVAEALEAKFEDEGLRVSLISVIQEEQAEAEAIFDGIVAMLLAMVVILAVVGGLGLAGTKGLNVIERTREIGVMRAIGASDWAIFRIFLIEGLTIGFLSWVLAVLAGLPLGKLIGDGIGTALLQTPLSFRLDARGPLIWLVLVLGVSALASYVPARRASRVSVREVLAYE